jgi:quercetin dioxygenase-like cupin family protein
MLTKSIPSGKINAQLITMSPGGSREIALHAHEGDEAALVLQGAVRFKIADESHDLGEGDSIYFIANQEHGYVNASLSEPAKMIWFASERKVD